MEQLLIQDYAYNAAVALKNALADLPGPRPPLVVLDLSGSYPARNLPRRPLDLLQPRPESLEEFCFKLSTLRNTPWLRGVVLRIGDLQVDLSTAYALRRAIADLASSKLVHVVANSLNMAQYLVASAGGQLAVPESAELNLSGLALGRTYLKDALERYGISFEKIAIQEYKSAFSEFTQSAMDDFDREQRTALLRQLQRSFCEEVASSRRVQPETVEAWLQEGVSSARRAKELGAVDRIAYEDGLLGSQRLSLAQAARFLKLSPRRPGEPRLAVVSVLGTIVTGKSRRNPLPLPLLGGAMSGSESVIRALRLAERDPLVSAVVLYVDSGGGSALASDLIAHEVERIRRKKPVVGVMGTLAASGGYYVLARCSRIVAAPTTLTGSIGVLSVKPVLQGFNQKYGLNPEVIKTAPLADLLSSDHPFSEQERAVVERQVAEIYDRFLGQVAAGRGLSKQQVDAVGRGRIWSGKDALDHRLVDELGDLELGLQRARELAGLPSDSPVWNIEAPRTLQLPDLEPAALLQSWLPLLRERVLLLASDLPTLR